MASDLSKEQIAKFKHVFSLYDKDGSGTISTKELGAVMRELGHNPSEIDLQKMMNSGDIDSNRSIDFTEFLNLITKKMKTPIVNETIQETFQAFDKDKNGLICDQEIRDLMENLGEKVTDDEIEEMIDEVDSNGDRQVNYKEFVAMINNE